jgi:leucyl-tRNA synthetase
MQDTQEKILLQYLTYLAESEVNCPGLGTVLANEIVNGVSERGGFTVVRKK